MKQKEVSKAADLAKPHYLGLHRFLHINTMYFFGSACTQVNPVLIDSHSSDSERGNKIEKEKSDSVSKAQSGQGEWKPELASQSEQIMQGEKSNMSMKEMQKMGEKKAEEGKKPSGSS